MLNCIKLVHFFTSGYIQVLCVRVCTLCSSPGEEVPAYMAKRRGDWFSVPSFMSALLSVLLCFCLQRYCTFRLYSTLSAFANIKCPFSVRLINPVCKNCAALFYLYVIVAVQHGLFCCYVFCSAATFFPVYRHRLSTTSCRKGSFHFRLFLNGQSSCKNYCSIFIISCVL